MMIPARIRQIAKTTGIACAVVVLIFFAYDRGAGIAFGITSIWMILNLFVWTIVMRIVLGTSNDKPVGLMLMAVTAKLFLLIGGVVALKVFAPYNRMQLYAIIAGVSSVLIVAFLKALGSKVAAVVTSSPANADKKRAAKV